MKSIVDAEKHVKNGDLENGLRVIDHVIENNSFDSDAMLVKATIYYKQQKWGDALNVLNKILEFDSENEKAKNYKQMVMNILAFWNKDSYNP